MISLDDDISTKRHLETYALVVDEEDDRHYVIDIGIIVTKHGYCDDLLGNNSPSKTSPARKRRKALKDSEVFCAPDILCINILGPVKLFPESALMQVENKETVETFAIDFDPFVKERVSGATEQDVVSRSDCGE